jgi:lysyl-tRNA synthetase class 2
MGKERIISNSIPEERPYKELRKLLESRVLIETYLTNFNQYKAGEEKAIVIGRLISLRKMGRIAFGHIIDESDQIQLVFDIGTLEGYSEHIRTLKLGDLILVRGGAFITNTQEKSLRCEELTRLASCSLPLPDKYHGIQDIYTKRKDRVLDLLTDRENFEFFRKGSIFVSELRMNLLKRGFLEFQTPILRRRFAAGAARPFSTEHNVWNKKAYLRLTPEIELRQLLIAGYEKVFELGKSFRNEGSDRIHNPEFTLLETYQAYSDFRDMMCLTEELIRDALLESFGTLRFPSKSEEVDFSKPWKAIEAPELCFSRICSGASLAEMDSMDKVERVASTMGIDVEGLSYGQAISKFLEVIIQPQIIQPTFIVHLPSGMSPFAKSRPDDPRWAERAWAFAGGIFFGDIYSDLTDPDELLQRLKKQDEELGIRGNVSHIENDLVNALRYGAPPSAGIGISIDRLLMIVGNKKHVLDTMLFPEV